MSEYAISVKLGKKTTYNIVRPHLINSVELFKIIFDYVLNRTGNRGTAAWIAGSVSNQLDDSKTGELKCTGRITLEA